MKRVKRIGAWSLGKTFGAVYAVLGFIIGGFITIIAVLGSTLSQQSAAQDNSGQFFSVFFGLGAIIFLPIIYGLMGFVAGVVSGWIYNLVASRTGGIEFEVQDV